jgi:alpha-methylacyl-CoA racemase
MTSLTPQPRGPLHGIRVLDLSGPGPAPFATMMLADFGASVLSVGRPPAIASDQAVSMSRGKDRIGIDLRSPDGARAVHRLAMKTDVLIEGFRPGVMERHGLGPAQLMAGNPRLIYARLTGWGQSGPYAKRAGHDINYLAISGALSLHGEGRPMPPAGLLGDLANGSYTVVIGVLLALHELQSTGRGQVIDAAIVDGAAYMLSAMFGERAMGLWDGNPQHHVLLGAAPFYGTYECADGRWFAVGAIEPKFYAAMLRVLGIDDVEPSPAAQMDCARWPALRARVAAIFGTRSQAEWTILFADAEACGAPVLAADELAADPHLADRRTVRQAGGALRAAPAPRLSAHPDLVSEPAPRRARSAQDILRDAGFSEDEIEPLTARAIVWSI